MKNPREEYKRITGDDGYYEYNIMRKSQVKKDYVEWLENTLVVIL